MKILRDPTQFSLLKYVPTVNVLAPLWLTAPYWPLCNTLRWELSRNTKFHTISQCCAISLNRPPWMLLCYVYLIDRCSSIGKENEGGNAMYSSHLIYLIILICRWHNFCKQMRQIKRMCNLPGSNWGDATLNTYACSNASSIFFACSNFMPSAITVRLRWMQKSTLIASFSFYA